MGMVGAPATFARESLEEALRDGAGVALACCLEVDFICMCCLCMAVIGRDMCV